MGFYTEAKFEYTLIVWPLPAMAAVSLPTVGSPPKGGFGFNSVFHHQYLKSQP
jgi:hypothetical protein